MQARLEAGVMLSCLERANGRPPPATSAVDPTEEGGRSATLVQRLRTRLTIIRGFADLLRRRAGAAGSGAPELVRITAATGVADALLSEYETATQLRLRHPHIRVF